MKDPRSALALQAAKVAANALKAISYLRPVLGPPNGEVKGFQSALTTLQAIYRKPKQELQGDLRREVEQKVDADDDWELEPIYEASRCQALLLEIIRRAAHDYVLYRQHRKRELKALAEQAYVWLFEEEPGHPAWKSRAKALFKVEDEDGTQRVEVGSRQLTSFLAICEACNLDPEAVRARAREMTVESIMRTGRHIERRRPKNNTDSVSIESHSVVVDIDMDALEAENQIGGVYDYYSERVTSDHDGTW